MKPVEIIEDGLRLRPRRAEDADAVHRACQDPDIQHRTTVPRPYQPRGRGYPQARDEGRDDARRAALLPQGSA